MRREKGPEDPFSTIATRITHYPIRDGLGNIIRWGAIPASLATTAFAAGALVRFMPALAAALGISEM